MERCSMTDEFANVLKQETQKRQGYYAAITPSMFADSPDCQGSCTAPKRDFGFSLKQGVDGITTLVVTFTVKDANLLQDLARKSGGKMKPPASARCTFRRNVGSWCEVETGKEYTDDAALAKELCDRAG
jgi:hypothetical protein